MAALRDAFRDPIFLAIAVVLLAVAVRPLLGITLWYDEAWRIVLATQDATWTEFLARWNPRDRVTMASPLYLALIRGLSSSLDVASLETALRTLSLLAFLAVAAFARALAGRWTGTPIARSSGAAAALLVAAHAYAGFYAIAIKEYLPLAAVCGAWALRLDAIARGRLAPGIPDTLLGLAAGALSPLGAIASGLACTVGGVAAWRTRCWRTLLPFLAGLIPVAVFVALQARESSLVAREFTAFSVAHGLPPGDALSLFGAKRLPLHLVLEPWEVLVGAPTWSAWRLPATLAAAGLLVASALTLLGSRSRRLLAVLGGLAALPAWIVASRLILGMDEPRFFLWLLPVSAALLAAAAALLPRGLGFALLALLIASSATGWTRWHESYPARIRFDEFLEKDGRFDRARDVLLHCEGLTWFPHRAWDPSAPVGVLPVPEDGLPRLTLTPGFRFQGTHDIAASFLWTDTRIASVRDGALWTVTTYGWSEAQIARIRRHAFDGQNRLETAVVYPWHWARISAVPDDDSGVKSDSTFARNVP